MKINNTKDIKKRHFLPVLNAEELRHHAEDLPDLPKLLDPIIATGSLGLVYAATGVGKTHFAVEIATAIATGGKCFGSSAPEKRRVLYIDGEMGTKAMSVRIEAARQRMPLLEEADNLRVLTYDECIRSAVTIPDMSKEDGLLKYSEYVQIADFIVIDNLSSLMRSGIENEAESWIDFNDWLLRQRAQGKAVLLVHHAGKNGSQRGTSKRLDNLDYVIKLTRIDGHDGSDGAWFNVEFEKSRGLFGEVVRPFEAKLTKEGWVCDAFTASPLMQVAEIYKSGVTSPSEIAKKMGKDPETSRGTVAKWISKCKEQGLIVG